MREKPGHARLAHNSHITGITVNSVYEGRADSQAGWGCLHLLGKETGNSSMLR
jgi:hypothetical protein